MGGVSRNSSYHDGSPTKRGVYRFWEKSAKQYGTIESTANPNSLPQYRGRLRVWRQPSAIRNAKMGSARRPMPRRISLLSANAHGQVLESIGS